MLDWLERPNIFDQLNNLALYHTLKVHEENQCLEQAIVSHKDKFELLYENDLPYNCAK